MSVEKSQLDNIIFVPTPGMKYEPKQYFANIFPLGEVSIVASSAGVGKTWLLLDILMKNSMGEDIFGEPVLLNNAKACIFEGELDENDITGRLKARLTGGQLWNSDYVSVVSKFYIISEGYASDLLNPEFIRIVRDTVSANGLKCIIFDSFFSWHTADENSSKEMNKILSELWKIAKEYECAVVLSHHTRKKDRRDNTPSGHEEISGSSVLLRLAQTAYLITHEMLTSKNVVRCVRSAHPAVKAFSYTVKPVEVSGTSGVDIDYELVSDDTGYASEVYGKGSVKMYALRQVIKEITGNNIGAVFTAREVTEHDTVKGEPLGEMLKMSDTYVVKAIDRLSKEGVVLKKEKQGRSWIYELAEEIGD